MGAWRRGRGFVQPLATLSIQVLSCCKPWSWAPPTLLLIDTCQPCSQADCMVTCVPVLICHQDPCWVLIIPAASSRYRCTQAAHITMYAHTPYTPRVPYITPLIFPTPRDILCTHPQHAYPSHQSQVPVIHLFTLSASLCPCCPVAAITVFL